VVGKGISEPSTVSFKLGFVFVMDSIYLVKQRQEIPGTFTWYTANVVMCYLLENRIGFLGTAMIILASIF